MSDEKGESNVTNESHDTGGFHGMVGALVGNLTSSPTHGSTATDNNTGKQADGYATDQQEADSNALTNLRK